MNATVLDYNTQRAQLPIPEYGRLVQRMVDHVMAIEDREQRTRQAKAIIQVIGRLNPQLRNSDNFERTLWDHLHIMSHFKLDVDAPFPPPTPEELDSKPVPVPYPRSEIRFGHYGKLVERMIVQCAAMEPGAEREAYTQVIANLMKRQFLIWNRDTVPDAVIFKDLVELSKGRIRVKEDMQLAHTADLLRTQQGGPRNEVDLRKRSGGGGGKKRHRNRKKNRY
jgi:hypothetical protein